MVARNWCNTDLANEAGVDPDTVAKALTEGAPLAQKTEARILAALSRKTADHAIAAAMKELAS
jgi:hypothetical protein